MNLVNSVEDLDANLKLTIKISCSQVDINPEMLLEEMQINSALQNQKFRSSRRNDFKTKEAEVRRTEDLYPKYLDLIQRHLARKSKKDFSVAVDKKVRLLSPFTIQTECHQNCTKEIILIRVISIYLTNLD